MGARWFALLRLRHLTVDHQGGRAATATFPGHRHLGLGGQDDGEPVVLRAVVRDLLTGRQVGVAIILVARGSEPGAAKCALGHRDVPPRRLGVLVRATLDTVTRFPPPWRSNPARGGRFGTCAVAVGAQDPGGVGAFAVSTARPGLLPEG